MSESEINKELNAISTLNGWGALGLLMPLVGIILYGISHSRSNKLLQLIDDKQREKYRSLIHGRKVVSTVMTLICATSIVVLLLVAFFANQRDTSYSTTTTTTPIPSEITPPVDSRQELNQCIDDVNSSIAEMKPQTYEEMTVILELRQQRVNECQIRYQ
ncbi:hypothetical protein [Streptomyces dysideae]|uniref:hypothetical protein n=1 Tax=Streptomyces dysideae TaxID=909626 RepID=UPI00131E2EE3|nr:hypothetical protein [Streptomyces dysideae]